MFIQVFASLPPPKHNSCQYWKNKNASILLYPKYSRKKNNRSVFCVCLPSLEKFFCQIIFGLSQYYKTFFLRLFYDFIELISSCCLFLHRTKAIQSCQSPQIQQKLNLARSGAILCLDFLSPAKDSVWNSLTNEAHFKSTID